MNWMAGNCLYNLARYEEAIPYYKTALSNMTINEYEAIYKLCIAKCYQKMGDTKNGIYWLNDAISEVKDNKEMVDELNKQYFADFHIDYEEEINKLKHDVERLSK